MDTDDGSTGGTGGTGGTEREGTLRHETPTERDDRNFQELLQELRVTQTGVQILFAFLLTLAFTPRFPSLDALQRGVYIATLLLAVLSAALFTAPAALHRNLFRRGAKRVIVDVSSRLASIGLAVLALSFTGAVMLVVDVVLSRAAAVGAAVGTLAVCVGLWRVLPWYIARTRTPVTHSQDSPAAPPRDRRAPRR